jgi:hypothetical protein
MYAMRNHMRNCVAVGGLDSGVDISSALGEDGDVDMVDMEEDMEDMEEDMEEDTGVLTAPSGKGVVTSLDDFEHLNQFMATGKLICTEDELQLVKFVHMSHAGYGVSRAFCVGMLDYSKQSGGKNMHLPDSWGKCVEETTKLIEKLEGKRRTFSLDVLIPENVRELLADPSQTHIGFEFECPITAMIRVAMFSKTCQDLNNVAFTYEDNNGYLDDFCNGDRYKRLAANMSPTGAILGAVLATDGICLDKCMFDSQEVCTFPSALFPLSSRSLPTPLITPFLAVKRLTTPCLPLYFPL